MARIEQLTESKIQTIHLTHDQAKAIQTAGRRLASDTAWWGESLPSTERRVIRCEYRGDDRWEVQVLDAIGLIAADDLILEVGPKIPLQHLLYLFSYSGHFPRTSPQFVGSSIGGSLWQLVARWYLIETERLLRKDLLRDYDVETSWLKVIRGRTVATDTSRALATGRLEAYCSYEEFNLNTPWNRVLLEASKCLSRSHLLDWQDRKRAMAIQQRFSGVGSIQEGDLVASLDRRSGYYQSAWSLACHIVKGHARTIQHGAHQAWTFLIRTPLMVEEGIRTILREQLGSVWSFNKKSLKLVGSNMTVNPDLVIGDGLAIADVKYKRLTPEWHRSDLYQSVAFAVAFSSRHAGIIAFSGVDALKKPDVLVGNVIVRELVWECDYGQSPEQSANQFVDRVTNWVELINSRRTYSQTIGP